MAVLDYDRLPDVEVQSPPIVPAARWACPEQNEFEVTPAGFVKDAWALNGFLQGRLHPDLRNPPAFLVRLPKGGALHVHLRAVATAGARLEFRVDGRAVRTVDVPDRDGKNDGNALEINTTFVFPIPPGRHRVQIANVGPDWARVDRYIFTGRILPWKAPTGQR